MVFQQPLFLYGLFLLAIPILIHFLNFRKSKTLYFSSLRFVEEVKSTYRKRNRLEDLLLLLLRLLILACLVIAFAQPVIQSKRIGAGSPSSVVGLYIDNSLSMELSEAGVTLLAKAKSKAKELLDQFPPGSRFQLLSNGYESDIVGITDKEQTLNRINLIEISPTQLSMAEILRFFNQGAKDKESKLASAILISDFQESMFSNPIEENQSDVTLFLIRINTSATGNISIDTCWLENPMTLIGQTNQIVARINNRSDQDYNDFPVRLVISDTLRNETTIKLPARTVTDVLLGFHPNTSGWHSGVVEISDFPVTFDNELQFSYRIESNIPVLQIFEQTENVFLQKVFGQDPYFKYESYTKKGYPRSDFKDYSLVILSGITKMDQDLSSKIHGYLLDGGTVWLFPELSDDLIVYNEFLKSVGGPAFNQLLRYRVDSKIAGNQNNWLQEVVVNVDKRLRLPYFDQSFKITDASPDSDILLNSVSGDPLLMRFRSGKGSFVLSAFPLDEKTTDFMYHPLFIPICYRIAAMSKHNTSLYHINNSSQPITVTHFNKNEDKPVRLKNLTGSFETIPVQHAVTVTEIILFPGDLPASGQYMAIAGSDTLARLAFNYGRNESNLSYLSDSVVNQRLRNTGWNIPVNKNSLSSGNSRELAEDLVAKKIWYYFLIIALLAVLAESFVMNRKK